MNTIEKDIFDITEGIISNNVNCLGIMDSGMALEVKSRFPNVYKEYEEYCRDNNERCLGHLQVIHISDNLYVANIFGQQFYGNTDRKYTIYQSFNKSFEKLVKFAKNRDLDIYVPYKIGSNKGGGRWDFIYSNMERISESYDYSDRVFICKLPSE